MLNCELLQHLNIYLVRHKKQPLQNSDSVLKFYRATIRRTLLFSKQYSRVKTRNSYTVSYRGERNPESILWGQIQYFISTRGIAFAIMKQFTEDISCQRIFRLPNSVSALDGRIVPVKESGSIGLVLLDKIIQKCVFVDCLSHAFVCNPPNFLIHD